MRSFQITGPGLDSFASCEIDAPRPARGEVLIRLHAASLNYLDLAVAHGVLGDVFPLVPICDGAGEIVELGEDVAGWSVGERVLPYFALDRFSDLRFEPAGAKYRGFTVPGSAEEYSVAPISALVRIPKHLSYVEAATLGIAATTAWSALSENKTGLGSTVVLLGTGGVSLFTLQLAKASGARVIVTSSSDEKLERARSLGADEVVNYLSHPEWDKEILRLTGGQGADLVVETVGPKTIQQSINAAATGGSIAIIGFISGMDLTLPILSLQAKRLTLFATSTGPLQTFKEVVNAIDLAQISPVVDKKFSFDAIPEAYKVFEKQGHFGKVAIDFNL